MSLMPMYAQYLKIPMDTSVYNKCVIPNNSVAKDYFEMFDKQLAGHLFYGLPLFGASQLFVKQLVLCQSMDTGLAMEAPLSMYDKETQILTTHQDAQQDSILSDVCSLPFFQDILADKQATDANKKWRKKDYTAPEMCFQIGSTCNVQTLRHQ